jgi:hypothetical protein
MNTVNMIIFTSAFIAAGVLLIVYRDEAGRHAAKIYRKFGIGVPDHLYAKQFLFIGILSIVFGFMVATGLISFL